MIRDCHVHLRELHKRVKIHNKERIARGRKRELHAEQREAAGTQISEAGDPIHFMSSEIGAGGKPANAALF